MHSILVQWWSHPVLSWWKTDMRGKWSSIVIVKIGLISFRPLLFFLPFSISFCFRWFRFISFLFRWFRFVSFLLISFRFRWFRFVSFLFRFALYRCPCLHFSGWNLRSHLSLHSSSLARSSCNISLSSSSLIILNILVSSANKYESDSTVSGISFIYI